MGQSNSQEKPVLEKRIQDPTGTPRGLAFVAHGRLGGHLDCPVTSTLAKHLCAAYSVRSITWNARGSGGSGGADEWSSLHSWMGNDNTADYNDIVREGLQNFARQFPDARNCELFICGYSAGAIHASTIRPPANVVPDWMFKPVKYILVSYPVLPAPFLGVFQTGWYFRALEGIVGGGGWENCQNEPRADVLTMNGSNEIQGIGGVYWWWKGIVASKRNPEQGALRQIEVEGADHVWSGCLHRIGEEVDRWIQEDVRR